MPKSLPYIEFVWLAYDSMLIFIYKIIAFLMIGIIGYFALHYGYTIGKKLLYRMVHYYDILEYPYDYHTLWYIIAGIFFLAGMISPWIIAVYNWKIIKNKYIPPDWSRIF